MTVNCHTDGIQLRTDHIAISSFDDLNGVLTQRHTKIYFANLVSVAIVKGDLYTPQSIRQRQQNAGEERKGSPPHVVFLKLVYVTGGTAKDTQYLRFADRPTYQQNLVIAQPWLNAIEDRIKAKTPRTF